ncbi:excinuclease ABC subunit UvrB [Mycoplasma sp. NEAQ87857]|uniref:excinuclease ABC subunit UvrB n=1 Tax=Mycoplasma sp. NEAQ87857 TaxID=2683967 RepID=UPI001316AC00|nr:excinuclease ABC subunit UvrB [Mycoplasma sp. NEAQ87857]QGZ97409.1 excinuclease ABC subunit UvrB [Mycoplasma sp. NEAQ87857]
MSIFKLHSNYQPKGDQPQAIKQMIKNIKQGKKIQVLKGVTGSGKTFTMANVIKEFDKPVLVLSHTKTLASQLYNELKAFFPENAVEYFISYFDYYRPEAYIPETDSYIEKDSKTNEQIEILRLSALNSLITRKDVIVVASVSAIFGALNPEVYKESFYRFFKTQKISMHDFIYKLININYQRNDVEQKVGEFGVKGDVIIIRPADEEENALRVSFYDDEIEEIAIINHLNKSVIEKVNIYTLSPGDEYATSNDVYSQITPLILDELDKQVAYFVQENKHIEAQRINQRVKNDVEDMNEFGHCKGIENYAMYLDKRTFGQRPYTILDFFPQDSLMLIDESHQSIPQLSGMYKSDRSRKEKLVNYGFRLPSAMENRPLTFNEWETEFNFQKIFISATPGEYELEKQDASTINLFIRPTGLIDPEIIIKPNENIIDDIYDTVIDQRSKNERTIVFTTTKRTAEEISNALIQKGIKAAYIHSDLKTFVRNEILRKLRMGIFEVVIAINLLREGIDLPEVSKVLILDADSTGLTRDLTSLVQLVGRAARNTNGQAIFYTNRITKSIQECLDDNALKRKLQIEYNQKHNIVPKTIIKDIPEPIYGHGLDNVIDLLIKKSQAGKHLDVNTSKDKKHLIKELTKQMNEAAKALNFEKAIELRDIITELETQ